MESDLRRTYESDFPFQWEATDCEDLTYGNYYVAYEE